ncbi:MAG: tetratricopeptide repeat protein, partial [Candidatus Eremiobacterota bacterium]
TVFSRAVSQRCLGAYQDALEDSDLALQFCKLHEDPDLNLVAALHQERAADYGAQGRSEEAVAEQKKAVELLKELADEHKTTRADVEHACAMVELAFLLDPSHKNYRSRSAWSSALEAFRKIKKREPSFGLGCELLRYVTERREPWGRPDLDLLLVERDLRVARMLLALLPRNEELTGLQKWLLELVEHKLGWGKPLPRGFLDEFFGFFSDLAGSVGRDFDAVWQGKHWLKLAELFGKVKDRESQLRSVMLTCVALGPSEVPLDATRLVQALEAVADMILKSPTVQGLELLGPAFQAVRGHRQQFEGRPEFVALVRRMANHWKNLPATVPGRAGVARTVLGELAE